MTYAQLLKKLQRMTPKQLKQDALVYSEVAQEVHNVCDFHVFTVDEAESLECEKGEIAMVVP